MFLVKLKTYFNLREILSKIETRLFAFPKLIAENRYMKGAPEVQRIISDKRVCFNIS